MSAERNLITGMSTCSQCGTAFETGDRFCQDCGASLPSNPPTAASMPAGSGWRQRLQQWRVERVPAEVILIGAACAYMASAALWSWSGQWHWKSAFAGFKMPSVHWQMPAFHLPAKQPDKPQGVTANGAAPSTVAKDDHASATREAGKVTAVQTPTVQTPAHADQVRRAAVQAAAPSASAQPAATSLSGQSTATAQPVAAETRTAGEHEPAAQNWHAVAATPERTRSKRIAYKAPAIESGAAEPSADTGEIKDLAEYNRLLAAYFEKPIEGSQPRSEPPSYSEWLASGKPQF